MYLYEPCDVVCRLRPTQSAPPSIGAGLEQFLSLMNVSVVEQLICPLQGDKVPHSAH